MISTRYTRNLKNKYMHIIYGTLEEKEQSHPWLAQQLADIKYQHELDMARVLAEKKHPARKSAEAVRELASEMRVTRKRAKMLEYQLGLYESLFPWLEEFKEIDIAEALHTTHDADGDDEYDNVKKWLSPAEYKKLKPSDRLQLALDRYSNTKKTNWQIGRDYERFIGYFYESQGFKVTYHGALNGFEDLGRDLICENDNEIVVVQCKYWSKSKTIHEKHIFQLFGSTILMRLQSPEKTVRGHFVTSVGLSDMARKCADVLQIDVNEERPMRAYPMIKCNIARKDGAKIYHLPFDQQYDKVSIEFDRGEKYVDFIKEAENLGFRHAYRWSGE